MAIQMFLVHLLLLMSGGLFYRHQWLSGVIVLAVYATTFLMVIKTGRDCYE
jgi:hypothetical protein